ncbi:MAG: LytTR family DNA-binding domain-containing protein [Bacteroidota bacterium]
MITAIILEDEAIAAKRLTRMVREIDSDIRILHTFESINETKEFYDSVDEHPDILFLDIHVADGNSFELYKEVEIKSKVIFTTAYDKYAIEAIRKEAKDYLLKPIKAEELSIALQKATQHIQRDIKDLDNTKERFLFRFGAKLNSIKIKDISYIYSKNKISYFVTKDGQRTPSDHKLQDLEVQLDPNDFYRANRQFIIHINSIDTIKTHSASRLKLTLNPPFDGNLIISTEKTREFKKWIDR